MLCVEAEDLGNGSKKYRPGYRWFKSLHLRKYLNLYLFVIRAARQTDTDNLQWCYHGV